MGCGASTRIDAVEKFAVHNRKFHHTYSLDRVLGSGSFGTVFLASRHDSDGQCAVKVVNIADRGAKGFSCRPMEDFRREHTAWARIGQHPNVVSFFEWHMDDELGYLVMELCQGSLYQAWKDEAELNEYTYSRYFADMVMALRHVHSMGIVHRDVKHDNFLLGGPQKRTVKLCDFGFATTLHDKANLERQVGSAAYMAPEVVTPHMKVGTASDVWSLGVIIYVSFFGRFPYRPKEKTRKAMCTAIRLGAGQPTFRPSSSLSQGAVSKVATDFVRAMLNHNPIARCSAEACLHMTYLLRAHNHAAAADERDLSAMSLKPMLNAAMQCGVFSGLDPKKRSHIHTTSMQQQDQHLAFEDARFDDQLKNAQVAHSKKYLHDMPSISEEGDFENVMLNLIEAVE